MRWILDALDVGGFGGHDGGVALTNVSDDVTLLSVQGPLSHQLLQPLVEGPELDDLDSFGFSTACEITFAGVPGVRCLRLTFVGELGFELHLPAKQVERHS